LTRYIVRRSLQALVVIYAVVTLVFFLMRIGGSDPAQALVDWEQDYDVALEQYRDLYVAMGLTRPVIVQYGIHVYRTFTGQFGDSTIYNVPAWKLLGERIARSAQIGGASVLLSIGVGIPLGVISALKRGSIIDTGATTISVLGLTIPNFWQALLMILIFGVWLGWMPIYGADTWKHMVMPSIVASSGLMATMSRFTRSGMLEVMRQDYIRTARAKGLAHSTVIIRHAMRNGLISVITILGGVLPTFWGGLIFIEYVFAWPGVGLLFLNSIQQQDLPVVFMLLLLISAATVFGYLLVDITYAMIDPRIRFR
jgi:peptide/nickel transport system permease protein